MLTGARGLKRFACLLVSLLLALFSSVTASSAAGPIKLGLSPVGITGSNFTLTMRPGESRDLAVQLVNRGAESVLTRSFAADAYSIVNGGFAVRLDGEPTTGTTTWLTYPTGDMDLAPGVPVERDFVLSVPATTEPGEYLTGIVLQNAEATSSDASAPGGMSLKEIVRQIVAVSIDVPGPRTPALGVGAITHRTVADRSTIAVEVQNLGNVRLSPTGEFVLWDSTGKEVIRFPVAMDTVYAHTDTFVEIPFSERLNPGDYAAELTLKDASGLAATSSNLLLNIPDAQVDTVPQVIGAPPGLAQTNQAPLPPAASTSPPPAVPALAQPNQTRIVPPEPTSPWLIALAAFGAGMAGMLTVVGVAFILYRRHRNA